MLIYPAPKGPSNPAAPESTPDAQKPAGSQDIATSEGVPPPNAAPATDGSKTTTAVVVVVNGLPTPGVDSVKDANAAVTNATSPADSKVAVEDRKSASSAASDSRAIANESRETPAQHRNQIVTFSSRRIDNVSDIMDALNISASASIKYGTIKGSGSASYVNENKVNESDLNYIVTVKVTNEVNSTSPVMKYIPIKGLPPQNFPSVFGDCFIAGFLEGGEFSAIISLKVGSNVDVKSVQLAAEVELQTGIPGLSVGANAGLDKIKADVWKDVEVTISVNWSGGGDIKTPQANWTLPEVIRAANAFPAQVSKFSQRTSAILMSYNSLRSFQAEQVLLAAEKMTVLDYGLCEVYTSDLWSAYQAFKLLWKDISKMIKKPYAYRTLDHPVDGEPPIPTDPLSLNDARLQCRKGMTQIVEEAKMLITNPSLAAVDSNGRIKAPPYKYPALLRARLPRYTGAAPSTTDSDLWSGKNWSPDEMAAIVKYTSDRDHLSFAPLVGEHIKDRPGKAFCTLDFNDTKELDRVIGLTVHAHEHHHFSSMLHPFAHGLRDQLSHFSKHAQGAITAIGFTTLRNKAHGTSSSSSSSPSSSSAPPPPTTTTGNIPSGILPPSPPSNPTTTCPCHHPHHIGLPIPHLSKSQPYISRRADTSSSPITQVSIGYLPGASNPTVGALKLTDSSGMVVLDWDMYRDCPEWGGEEKRGGSAGLVVERVEPPREEEEGEELEVGAKKGPRWALGGFWGSCGEVVVARLGVVWRRV